MLDFIYPQGVESAIVDDVENVFSSPYFQEIRA